MDLTRSNYYPSIKHRSQRSLDFEMRYLPAARNTGQKKHFPLSKGDAVAAVNGIRSPPAIGTAIVPEWMLDESMLSRDIQVEFPVQGSG